MASAIAENSNACKRLVIFDFDHTLVNCNSDEHIFPMLTGGKSLPFSYEGGSWLKHMNQIFQHLHNDHSIKEDDFARALATLPFISGIPELIRKLASRKDTKLMVLSDANTIFIERALEANKLRQYFTCIMTNHAEFDEQGLLKVRPHEEQAKRAVSGSCPTQECPENLCKGSEIGRIIQEFKQFGEPEIWYCGDGWNDWCAAIQLPSNKHHVFARKGYTLHGIIEGNTNLKKKQKKIKNDPTLKANASFWLDGHELLECMARLDPTLKLD